MSEAASLAGLAALSSPGAGAVALSEQKPAPEGAFDSTASLYDAWFNTPLGRTVDELEKDLLRRFIGPAPGGRALEVGCGTGHFVAELAAQGWTVVGLDLSAEMLAVARDKQASMVLARADAAALPWRDASFDLVLSVTTLEFMTRRQEALQQMWRVLRPGGRLVVGVLNALSPWAWQRRRESRRSETPFSQAHFFAPREFVRLLGGLGAVQWSSSVFIGPAGQGLHAAWALERLGRAWLKPFGALLVGRVQK